MAVNFLGPVRLTIGLLPAMRAQRFGHVVNIVTWGVQMKAPKFSAYIASKTALDVVEPDRRPGDVRRQRDLHQHALRAGAHADDRAPTEAYAGLPGLTPEQAARRIVRALEDRPLTGTPCAGTSASGSTS